MDDRSGMVKLYDFILSRRYRVKIKGLEVLAAPGTKLFLPNHQSHIDPQLIAVVTAKQCDFVPVISENILKIPILSYFMNRWNAVSVSKLKGGKGDPSVLKKIFSQVIEALQNKKSVIIYPSGEISHTPIEKIKNKQSAYVIVSNLPKEVKVIGVRISGLWGSMWSVAWKGKRPSFILAYLKGVFYFFANFIFFSPKRDVTFEYVDITTEAKLKAQDNRQIFNTFLEDFYNINGPEKASYIKHFFYFPKSRRIYPENLM